MRDLKPELVPGSFVFVRQPDFSLEAVEVHASVREPEGTTVVIDQSDADNFGLEYDYVAAWITLRVDSTLEEVGLTASFSRCLADAGISCNVLAGLHHDHLLVPAEKAGDALAALEDLSQPSF
ncbi:MAG: ACT domain-containing protein [Solirubrobacterales bacterium]